MFLRFAFQIITTLILIWPIINPALASAEKQARIIAQNGCNPTCGGIEIPFPFGMNDPKCYGNISWFEIECRNTSSEGHTHKPYLKHLDLEVTDIDVSGGTMGIMNPVYHWNCQGRKNKKKPAGINLRGSPFVYSQKNNKFMATGCKKIALLRSNGAEVGGCVSICDRNDEQVDSRNTRSYGCSGKYCCETSLPFYLSEYNATLLNLRKDRECSLAAILSSYFIEGFYSPSIIADLKDRDYVEAVLEWEILNEFLNNSTLIYSTLIKLPQGQCYESDVTSDPQKRTTSGIRCSCPNGLDGNPYITGGCTAIPESSTENTNSRMKKWAIVGVSSSLGSIFLLLGLWLLHKIVRKRIMKKRKEKFFRKNGGLLLQQRMSSEEVNVNKGILFSLDDLEKATDNFSLNRVLGKGGQGTVYKGMLVDGKIVAVKKFKVEGKIEQFINEFVILSQINHRNVVKLLGCCLETEIPLLVYEFIPNGNLYEYLHVENEEFPVTWEMRLRIAIEIAGSLFYLHSVASQPIYHRDIKSTNILLDEKYRAKVADFGASRIVSNVEDTHLTTVVQGTFGYLDPEYFYSSQFTDKSDVYSFGVVLVELLTSKKPISTDGTGEAQSLASCFVQCMEENCVFDIIDKRVLKEGKREDIIAVANLANKCLELNGKKRPSMRKVTLELEGIQGKDKMPNRHQKHDDIEIFRVDDHQSWGDESTSFNSLPNLSNEDLSSDSKVMHILSL